MGEIQTAREGKVLVVTIANEAKRNALDTSMEQPFLDCLVEAERDDGVRAVVLTGAGDVAFCSGHDLSEVGRPGVKFLRPDPMGHPALMEKPVIAAVNGHCFAAGLMMALCCDLRIAGENAVFGQPGARLGQLPVGGQIWRLASEMSKAKAMEMMLTADPLTAEDALCWGLVSRIAPKGQVLSTSLAIAHKIAANSPNTVKAIKKAAKVFERDGLAAFDAYEREAMMALMHGPDRLEGSRAFAEKRAPAF